MNRGKVAVGFLWANAGIWAVATFFSYRLFQEVVNLYVMIPAFLAIASVLIAEDLEDYIQELIYY